MSGRVLCLVKVVLLVCSWLSGFFIPHMTFPLSWGRRRGRERGVGKGERGGGRERKGGRKRFSSSYKATNLIKLGPYAVTSFKLTDLHKGPISKYSHIKLKISYKFWGGHDSVHGMARLSFYHLSDECSVRARTY